MNKKIIFSSGGTGGHIFPAINLMKHYLDKGYRVLLVTDIRGSKFLKNYPEFESYIINTSSPINKNLFRKVLAYLTILFSIVKSFIILRKEKPCLVFGFGGYVSFPICFVSKFFKIPLIIYENNIAMGIANKYLTPHSKKVLYATKIPINFSEKYKNKLHFVGSILKKDILNYSFNKKNIDKYISILILGGSQGAEIFGKIIPPAIKLMKDKGYDIMVNQQCIISQKESIIKFYNENKINNNVFDFDKNILKIISTADLAITRCGASTIAELAYSLTPFIAVPIPNSFDNHQYLNAKYYENKKICWILEQKNFNTENLFNLIIKIIENKKNLENIRENMKSENNKNAYTNIENQIKEFLHL